MGMVTYTTHDSVTRAEYEVQVQDSTYGAFMRIKGMGDAVSARGRGWPIMIEMRAGVPWLVVWADASDPEPTHSIDMSKAWEGDALAKAPGCP